MVLSNWAMPMATDSRSLIVLVWMTLTSDRSASRRMALPLSMKRMILLHASGPFNTSARLKIVSASPVKQLDKNPQIAAFSVSCFSSLSSGLLTTALVNIAGVISSSTSRCSAQ